MFKRIDRSPGLARMIERLSGSLAKQRGLPTVIGILLIIISFVVRLFDVYVDNQALELIWVITHHLGIIIALVGLLLVEPLGK
jgi:hypothetical protein